MPWFGSNWYQSNWYKNNWWALVGVIQPTPTVTTAYISSGGGPIIYERDMSNLFEPDCIEVPRIQRQFEFDPTAFDVTKQGTGCIVRKISQPIPRRRMLRDRRSECAVRCPIRLRDLFGLMEVKAVYFVDRENGQNIRYLG